jgi:hypothetical protein
VVERAVLLHQDHDVLDVHDGAGPVSRWNGQRLANAGKGGSPLLAPARKSRRVVIIDPFSGLKTWITVQRRLG